jgi:hypothetical protein
VLYYRSKFSKNFGNIHFAAFCIGKPNSINGIGKPNGQCEHRGGSIECVECVKCAVGKCLQPVIDIGAIVPFNSQLDKVTFLYEKEYP